MALLLRPPTGDLTIGDVGQNAVEEIDFARKGTASGANYGWRPFEGRRRNFDEPAPGAVPPVLELPNPPNCSVTGGYVVRDRGVPGLLGRYVYGDFCQGELRAARLSEGSASGDRSLGLRRSAACRRSARTASGASTPSRSAARCIASSPAERRRGARRAA